MALAKLLIIPETSSGLPEIKVLFNPNTYRITKSVRWRPGNSTKPGGHSQGSIDGSLSQFAGGETRALSLELFFDVTEPQPGIGTDVRKETDKLVALTQIVGPAIRPPACSLHWGRDPLGGSTYPFHGVIQQLTQVFTFFHEDGTPLRAKATVDFSEVDNAGKNTQPSDSGVTSWLLKRGDTLSAIASTVYRDPGLWREIAEANALDDPLNLPIGQRLSIPAKR